jgi:hypothetical protein
VSFQRDSGSKILIIEVSLDGVVINGVSFTCGVPLDDYLAATGNPSRSESPGPPAPYGHRNGVLHFYDKEGLFLREHHDTRVIHAIDILLDPSSSKFPTTQAFSGTLVVCDVEVVAGMKFTDFAEQCEVEFKPHLGHAWYVDGKHISIQFEVVSPSRKRGTRRTEIARVAVGFRGADCRSVIS